MPGQWPTIRLWSYGQAIGAHLKRGRSGERRPTVARAATGLSWIYSACGPLRKTQYTAGRWTALVAQRMWTAIWCLRRRFQARLTASKLPSPFLLTRQASCMALSPSMLSPTSPLLSLKNAVHVAALASSRFFVPPAQRIVATAGKRYRPLRLICRIFLREWSELNARNRGPEQGSQIGTHGRLAGA